MPKQKRVYQILLVVSILATLVHPLFVLTSIAIFYKYNSITKTTIQTRQEDAEIELEKILSDISILKQEVAELEQEAFIKSVLLDDIEGITSEEIKNKLLMLKEKEKVFISRTSAATRGQGKSVRDNSKQITRCFLSECEHHFISLNYRNIDKVRSKIKKSFDVLNKLFMVDGVMITNDYLELKLKQAVLIHSHHLKKEQEKEEQKAIREQMAEEAKAYKEIEREQLKIEKEEKQFKAELNKLMQYMNQSTNDVQTKLYLDKINELEEKLRLLDIDKANVFERQQNTRAGFVYIISNIGSFGEDVYKIGMTRRLEPMDRIKELGSASVPFEFDVHAMIFSEDAPALETMLHHHFRKYELNKINPRKEFFRVPLQKIADLVRKRYNATVHFTMVVNAFAYRESVRLEESFK